MGLSSGIICLEHVGWTTPDVRARSGHADCHSGEPGAKDNRSGVSGISVRSDRAGSEERPCRDQEVERVRREPSRGLDGPGGPVRRLAVIRGAPGRLRAQTCFLPASANSGKQRHRRGWPVSVWRQPANPSSSWPSGAGSVGGGARGARPCSMSRGRTASPVATSAQRMGPPQRGQVSRSARNTCARSQLHRCRWPFFSLALRSSNSPS